ncbi:hypothetical protein [Paraburkholderia sp. BCC1876]|uniref:hypothetical protein n=1 Tax=Paraburkholderia sp. BCC1876 TaxID=2676303 RepID=UPI001590BCC4|nr:hypothetical protein [Paraburkholderia sp. BCC1876]
MKPLTVDMLRAHLIVASFTALCAQLLACVALLLLPVSQQLFSSTPFRLLAVAAIVSGVIVTREFAQAAFDSALQSRHVTSHEAHAHAHARCVAIAADCPQCWLVVLHLRLTGRPFVLAAH